ALKVEPTSARTLNNLGIALGSQGHMEQAIDQFRQAIAVQPDSEDAKRNLAMALRVRKKD
ncbi:MAG: tetratricopeptide repeat protein, partial [Vicinamibacterales bacterium]